jgi:DNA-binding MarR family transcriptional regulator
LFAAHLKGVKMRTKELCATSGLPQTTVLRYLDHLEKLDMVRRETDPDDSRVTLIVMTDWGALWLREYYSQVFASQKRLATKGQGLLSLNAKSIGATAGDV